MFALNDLIDLASYDSIRKVLSRLATAGCIERIVPGIYRSAGAQDDPTEQDVAMALARSNGWQLIPGTESARYLLGQLKIISFSKCLTESIPAMTWNRHRYSTRGVVKSMRDSQRIDPLLAKLGEAWKKYPDGRFGQLLSNFFTQYAVPVFYTEDDVWLAALQAYADGDDPHTAIKTYNAKKTKTR